MPDEIKYLEPTFPDEYAAKKGRIADPMLTEAEMAHPLLPVLHKTMIQTHKLFSSSFLSISSEETLFDLPQQPQIENVIPFYQDGAWLWLHIHTYNDSIYAVVYDRETVVVNQQID